MITLNQEVIGFINLFEKVTRAQVKDCFSDDGLVFVVQPGQMGLAIGKKGVNIKKVSGLLKKKVKVISDSAKLPISNI